MFNNKREEKMTKYSVTNYLSMGEGVVAVKVAKVETTKGYVTNILKRDKGMMLELTDTQRNEFSRIRNTADAKVYLSKVVNKQMKFAK